MVMDDRYPENAGAIFRVEKNPESDFCLGIFLLMKLCVACVERKRHAGMLTADWYFPACRYRFTQATPLF